MKHLIKYAALAAVLTAFFGYYCTSLWDMDFWWHIATGRNIVESHAIPGRDPFGMYVADSLRSDMVLKGYWLAQIAFFFIFDFWGANGIIFLKAGILVLCLAVTFTRSKLIGSGGISALLVLSFAGMALLDFTGERPQLFSFLYFTLAILILDFSRERKIIWPLYLLPLLMLLWANSHGGVVLGGVVLGLMAVAYAVEGHLSGNYPYGGKWLFVILVAAVLFTFISPNGLNTYLALVVFQLEEGELRDRTSEFMSPIKLWRDMGMMLPFYWSFILLALAAFPKAIRKPHFTPLLLALFLGGLSLSGFRYIPFFMLFAAPYVALGLTRLTRQVKLPVAPLYGVLFVAALCALGYGVKQGKAFQGGIRENHFPQGAVDFMQRNGLAGKIFNAFAWGGYLNWHLYPQSKVFIDGRVLDSRPLRDYTHILWTTPYGLRQLENNQFDFVLIQYANAFTGEKYKLNDHLLQSPEWQMLYRDQTGYLFARKSGMLRQLNIRHGS